MKSNNGLRYKYEDVKIYIEGFGYFLISAEYKGCKKKLLMKCNNNHTFEMNFDNFKQGKRCWECNRGIKWNIDKAKQLFEEKGLILLEEIYINNSTKMKYKCKIHYDKIQESALGNVQQGKGCKYCAIEKTSSVRRRDIDIVIETIESKGFRLLNPESYVNGSSILEVECEQGHISKDNYINIRNLLGCKVCKGHFTNKEQVKEFAESRGYTLLKFTSTRDNITVKCSNNHITKIAWNSFRKGQDCTECTGNIRSKYTYEMVYKIFKENDMTLLSKEYQNQITPLKFLCGNGHIGKMKLNTVLRGSGCMRCGKAKATISRNITFYENGTQKSSRQQRFIHSVIGGELNYPINMYSLDIAFPKEKIYVEYDGGGHDLSVKLGDETKEEFDRKHLIRSVYLSNNGWYQIRIISPKSLVPNESKLIGLLNNAKNLFDSGRSWVEYNLDENKIITSKFKKEYDFGQLHSDIESIIV